MNRDGHKYVGVLRAGVPAHHITQLGMNGRGDRCLLLSLHFGRSSFNQLHFIYSSRINLSKLVYCVGFRLNSRLSEGDQISKQQDQSVYRFSFADFVGLVQHVAFLETFLTENGGCSHHLTIQPAGTTRSRTRKTTYWTGYTLFSGSTASTHVSY